MAIVNKLKYKHEAHCDVSKLEEGDRILFSVNEGTNNSSSSLRVGFITRFTEHYIVTTAGRVPKVSSRIWGLAPEPNSVH